MGRRKRVDNIEVLPVGDHFELDWWEKAEEHFKGEETTKQFSPHKVLLHAWTDRKVEEYVLALMKIGGYSHLLRYEKDGKDDKAL